MLHQWNIRSRAHQCAVTGRAFEDGERHYTAIYFDSETGEFSRRDVCADAWEQETSEHNPFSFWRTIYEKPATEAKPELAAKESAMDMLHRLIEEGNPATENSRYILALMLERKRILSPTATKDTEEGRMLFYENKKTGEVFIIRDPELRLDEIASVQEEVAFQLGFGGPAAAAAKVAGVELTAAGKVVPKEMPADSNSAEQPAEAAASVDSDASAEDVSEASEDEEDLDEDEDSEDGEDLDEDEDSEDEEDLDEDEDSEDGEEPDEDEDSKEHDHN